MNPNAGRSTRSVRASLRLRSQSAAVNLRRGNAMAFGNLSAHGSPVERVLHLWRYTHWFLNIAMGVMGVMGVMA